MIPLFVSLSSPGQKRISWCLYRSHGGNCISLIYNNCTETFWCLETARIYPDAVKAWVNVGSMPLATSNTLAILFLAQIVFHQTSLIAGLLPVTAGLAAYSLVFLQHHVEICLWPVSSPSPLSLSACPLIFHARTCDAALMAGGREWQEVWVC